MRYPKPAVSKPAIGNRAAEPLTTDELLVDLGYKVLPRTFIRTTSPMATRYRRSGGKRGGYCPMPS